MLFHHSGLLLSSRSQSLCRGGVLSGDGFAVGNLRIQLGIELSELVFQYLDLVFELSFGCLVLSSLSNGTFH